MIKTIVSRNASEFQLVSIGIELVHKVFGLMECNPELISNPHAAKASELANKWNEVFIEVVSTRKVK